jgi:hypothetical protein
MSKRFIIRIKEANKNNQSLKNHIAIYFTYILKGDDFPHWRKLVAHTKFTCVAYTSSFVK